MADSIREQITQKLLLRLQTITIANGYETNLGERIIRARRSFDENCLPAGAVWPGTEESEKHYKNTRQTMEFAVEAHNNIGTSTADVIAHQLIADIRKAMETRDAAVEALVENIGYTGATPEYPDDGGTIVSVKLTFAVEYMTVKGDPYSQP